MKMIEVSYRFDGSEWKTAKTKKLCKLLERVFGKNSCFDTGYPFEKFMMRHFQGHKGYYNVLQYDDYYDCFNIVGEIFISSFKSQGIDITDMPHKFFEGATFKEAYNKVKTEVKNMSKEEKLKKIVKHYLNGRFSETEFKDLLSRDSNLEKIYRDIINN